MPVVEVFSDLREVIAKRGGSKDDGLRLAAGSDQAEHAKLPVMAGRLPSNQALAVDGPSKLGPRPLIQDAQAAVTSKPNTLLTSTTSSPSDLLSPCSEALLRRRFRIPRAAGSLERSLADASTAGAPRQSLRDSLPSSVLPAPIADSSTSAAVDAEISLRSPLASLGTPSNANTPRARAARSFGAATTPKNKDAAPKAVELQRLLSPAVSLAHAPAVLATEDDCVLNDENATGSTPSADELRFKFERLQAMDKDGTVFRLLQGDNFEQTDELAPPDDDDGFFVLPDEPNAELRAVAVKAAAQRTVWSPPTPETSGFGAGSYIGAAALATTVGVAVCVGLTLQRRGN